MKHCCICYAPAVTDFVFDKRKLPLRNAPTTQRITRIAGAVRASGRECFVLSPGIMPRIKSTWRLLPHLKSRHNNVPILTIKQLGVRVLGYMVAPFFAIAAAVKIARKRKISTVIEYNFNPDALTFGIFCKLVFKSKLILEIEDISQFHFSDWLPNSGVRAFNQMFTCFLQKIALRACDAIIAPSKKFLPSLPKAKPAKVITGCQRVIPSAAAFVLKEKSRPIVVLLSGSLTLQNGLGVFFDALELMQSRCSGMDLSFTVCGVGDFDYVHKRMESITKIKVDVLGTLSNSDFHNVYDSVDIVLVLQNPHGRFGESKSPSKGYEAIASGKTIVVTDIGDFGELPDDVCYHLNEWTGTALARILEDLSVVDVRGKRINAVEYAKRNYSLEAVAKKLKEIL